MNINSIETFMNIKGGLANDIRDVYFIRMLGENATLISTIDEVDTRMNEKMHQGALKYIRINELPKLANSVDVEFYSSVYEAAGNNGRINFKNINANDNLQTVIKNAYTQVVDEYAKDKNNVSESMKKNLVVKILFWLDSIAKDILKEWDERKCIKVVADNIEKEQECLFYLFLTFIGCDVLLIENRKDVNVNDKIKAYTKEFRIGDFGNAYLSKYEYKPPMARTNQGIQNNLYLLY